jgi:hypothetical protein
LETLGDRGLFGGLEILVNTLSLFFSSRFPQSQLLPKFSQQDVYWSNVKWKIFIYRF